MIICCVFLQDGETALHKAAWHGHDDIVNILLRKNTDIVTQTDNVSEQIIQLIYSNIDAIVNIFTHASTLCRCMG